MEIKDIIGLGTLIVSGFSAIFALKADIAANDAKEAANNFKRSQFLSQTSVELLHSSVESLNSKDSEDDAEKKDRDCLFIGLLSAHEKRIYPNDKEDKQLLLVKTFIRSSAEKKLLPQGCALQLAEDEHLEDDIYKQAYGLKSDKNRNNSGTDNSIGKWHAVIASYEISDRGCQAAKEDIPEFRDLLSKKSLPDLPIYVAQTETSKVYAVTVDAGDNLALARKVSSAIRNVSSSSVDGKTGADSFVQVNKGWTLPEDCDAERLIIN